MVRVDPAARHGRSTNKANPPLSASWTAKNGTGWDVRTSVRRAVPGARIWDKTAADRQSERLYAPLVPPRRCPPYVRNHCYASTHSDTR